MFSTFLGPKWPKKVSISRGPTLPMPLVMDIARLKTITYRAM